MCSGCSLRHTWFFYYPINNPLAHGECLTFRNVKDPPGQIGEPPFRALQHWTTERMTADHGVLYSRRQAFKNHKMKDQVTFVADPSLRLVTTSWVSSSFDVSHDFLLEYFTRNIVGRFGTFYARKNSFAPWHTCGAFSKTSNRST